MGPVVGSREIPGCLGIRIKRGCYSLLGLGATAGNSSLCLIQPFFPCSVAWWSLHSHAISDYESALSLDRWWAADSVSSHRAQLMSGADFQWLQSSFQILPVVGYPCRNSGEESMLRYFFDKVNLLESDLSSPGEGKQTRQVLAGLSTSRRDKPRAYLVQSFDP